MIIWGIEVYLHFCCHHIHKNNERWVHCSGRMSMPLDLPAYVLFPAGDFALADLNTSRCLEGCPEHLLEHGCQELKFFLCSLALAWGAAGCASRRHQHCYSQQHRNRQGCIWNPALLVDIQLKSAVSKGDPVTAQQIPLKQDCSVIRLIALILDFVPLPPSSSSDTWWWHCIFPFPFLPWIQPSHWIPAHPYHLCFHILVSSDFVNIFLSQCQDSHDCVDSVSWSCFSDISHLGGKCQTSMVSLLFTV